MDYFCFESVGHVDPPIVIDFENHEKGIAFYIGKSLSEYRKLFKVSQSTMAEYFDVSIGQYRKYEAGIDIPKMHSAARWSALTGMPMSVLFKYTEYAKFFTDEELNFRIYLGFVSRSTNREFYSVLTFVTGEVVEPTKFLEDDYEPDFELALADVVNNYYYRVIKNFEAIRSFHEISKGEMSFLLGISCSTYNRYVSKPNDISISLIFYARAHAALRIKSNWSETGTSYYALINKRRRGRIITIEDIARKLPDETKKDFYSILYSFGESCTKIRKILNALNINH